MKERCYKPNAKEYHCYGGRGIQICDQWRHSFQQFYADMGPRPSLDHSIDRIDNNGNYTPQNCRWTTRYEQMRNMTRNHWLTHPDGRRMVITDWTRLFGCSRNALRLRLNAGWSEARTLTTPIRFQSHR
jgi:hypothetical protein